MSDKEPDVEDGGRLQSPLGVGALVGASAGVLLVALLRHYGALPPPGLLRVADHWYIEGYELPVALLTAGAIWLFCPGRGVVHGLAGAGAVLLGMLAADVCRALSHNPPWEWLDAPRWVARSFTWGGWPKTVRYVFGVYLGWYVCSSGRAAPEKEARREAA